MGVGAVPGLRRADMEAGDATVEGTAEVLFARVRVGGQCGGADGDVGGSPPKEGGDRRKDGVTMSRTLLKKMVEVEAGVEQWTCDQCGATADSQLADNTPHPMPDGWVSVAQYKGNPGVDERAHFDTYGCAGAWCAGKEPTRNTGVAR